MLNFEFIEGAPGANVERKNSAKRLVRMHNFRKRNYVPLAERRRLEAVTIYETDQAEVSRRMAVRNQKLIEGVK